jgi:hypothetical protein
MKSLFLSLLTVISAFGQYIGFQTKVGVEVDAPVALGDGSPPGPSFQAQIVRVLDDGTLAPLQPTTTFQTNATVSELRYYVRPINLIVPGITFPDIFADPIEITVRMRVWEGSNWATSTYKGESEDLPILLRNLLFPPTNLAGLKGFTVERYPRIAATVFGGDGSVQMKLGLTVAVSSVRVERSVDLKAWQEIGEFFVFGDEVAFDDQEVGQRASVFYRVKLQ